ncbi:hypothetical protein Zmor_012180 [Zophobas morio]|jgi:nucleolar protein 58|uniref:Nucleolar protein 58 n=1 Tax=Zophobas morio TaxID=2755281 RepID=A0AA38HH63_9CUCU|nr:hypothetical protein Zmor_012180 [Zophobas morio]
MLILLETPAGFALFKVLKEGKLSKPKDLWKSFTTVEKANEFVKLLDFHKFRDTVEALANSTAIVEGKVSSDLDTFLRKWVKKGKVDVLGVADAKFAGSLKEKLGISCSTEESVKEVLRGIRGQVTSLISGMPDADFRAMNLGLAHSLSRYKLKFSPEKVDTMIIQSINLLDDLDKELNTCSMRAREWYGLHFPECSKLIPDNVAFARSVLTMRTRCNASSVDLSDILPEEVEEEVKRAAEISMGSDISGEDINNICALCEQVVNLSEYRAQLFDYLRNRMNAVAPNLTVMVGELVGARLIAHAGSLLNLAKCPASTVQILGAEKALFRALKNKSNTPKYGLIYHASLVGQSAPKHKGKISRVLAAKTALSIRCDALGEVEDNSVGIANRLKVESRLSQLEGRPVKLSGLGKSLAQAEKYEPKPVSLYNPATDSTVGILKKRKKTAKDQSKKIKHTEVAELESVTETIRKDESIELGRKHKKSKKEKKEKKSKITKVNIQEISTDIPTSSKKSKKSKKKQKEY